MSESDEYTENVFSCQPMKGYCSWADPEGQTPLVPEKSPKIGFLSILFRFLLKSQSYQASMRCWANDGLHIVVFGSSLPSSPKRNGQSWTPSDKTFWIRACSWAIMFYVRSRLSCAKAITCYPTLKTTTARGLKAAALILDIMLSLRLQLCPFVCG